MTLALPSDVLGNLPEFIYKDRDALCRLHMRLMLVDKHFYASFNGESMWRYLFGLYFQIDPRITLESMRAFINLNRRKAACLSQLTRVRKEAGLGYDAKEKRWRHGKKGGITKLRTMDLSATTRHTKVKYQALMFDIEKCAARITTLKRRSHFKKLSKKQVSSLNKLAIAYVLLFLKSIHPFSLAREREARIEREP